jgi:protein-S-isoprenylcysteine O-methyltransferase Ste14
LAASLFLVIQGVYFLHRLGKPDSRRTDDELIGFEKTTKLVTIGAYRYIRHPLYSSALLGSWGVFFKQISIWAFLAAIIATFFLTMTAKMEEKENIKFFGDDYTEYMKRTRMFIPYLF